MKKVYMTPRVKTLEIDLERDIQDVIRNSQGVVVDPQDPEEDGWDWGDGDNNI